MASDILERFEQLVRKRTSSLDPAWSIERGDGFLRAIGPSPSPFDNSLCWARTDAGNADEVIREQIEYFRKLGRVTEELKTRPDLLSVFVGWAGAQPVCSSWLRIEEGTPFASLWGGSVHPDFRGKGLYRAMVEARVQEARRRNIAYLYVEAGEMSRPILERLGFQALSKAAKCIYSPSRTPMAS